MVVDNKPIVEDIQLLVVKDAVELNDDSIEALKTGLDPLIKLDIEKVFKVVDCEELGLLSKFELSQVTHVISNSIDIPNYDIIAFQLMIPVVSSEWLKVVIANKRIYPVRPFYSNPKHIFKDALFAVSSDFSKNEKLILQKAIRTFGGTYLEEMKKSLTHVISDNLEDNDAKLITAFNEMNKSGKAIQLVNSKWLFDCINERKLLPASGSTKTEEEKDAKRPEYLTHFHFKISKTMQLSKSLLAALHDSFYLSNSGKEVVYLTNEVDKSVDLSTKQRTFDYFFAILFHETTNLKFDSLLFHPLNGLAVEGMEHVLVATTNYTGDARIYIEELTERMGGRFSKTLKAVNTHLVASKGVGKKFEFAKSWNVKIVSHMWVEDTFINWKIMDESSYDKFPRSDEGVRYIGDVRFGGFSYEPETKQEKSRDIVNVNNDDVIGSQPENESNDGKSNEETQIKTSATLKDEVVSGDANTTAATSKKTEENRLSTDDMGGNLGDKTQEEAPKETSSVWEMPDDKSEEPQNAVTSKKRKAMEFQADGNDPVKVKEKVAKTGKSGKPYDITAIVTGFDGTLSATDKRELKKVGITIVENASKSLNCIIAPSLLRTQKFLTALSYDPKYLLEPLFLSDVLGTLDSVKKIGDFTSISPKVDKYNIWEHVDFERDIAPKKLFHKGTTREMAIEYMNKSRNGLFEKYVFHLSSGLAGGFDTLKSILKSYGCKECVNFKEGTKSISVNRTKLINGVSDVAVLVCGARETKIHKHFAKLCSDKGVCFVLLEWDVVVTAIFEGGLQVNAKNVLQQHGVL